MDRPSSLDCGDSGDAAGVEGAVHEHACELDPILGAGVQVGRGLAPRSDEVGGLGDVGAAAIGRLDLHGSRRARAHVHQAHAEPGEQQVEGVTVAAPQMLRRRYFWNDHAAPGTFGTRSSTIISSGPSAVSR